MAALTAPAAGCASYDVTAASGERSEDAARGEPQRPQNAASAAAAVPQRVQYAAAAGVAWVIREPAWSGVGRIGRPRHARGADEARPEDSAAGRAAPVHARVVGVHAARADE